MGHPALAASRDRLISLVSEERLSPNEVVAAIETLDEVSGGRAIAALGAGTTVATLLPGTMLFLGKTKQAPGARQAVRRPMMLLAL